MSHPSEAGHWYAPDGTPVYEVKARDGSMRPTTLRDAKKMGLYPSVTGIIRCAAAPGLEFWKQQQVLLAALTLPRLPAENDESFCKRVIEDSKEQAKKAAEGGTKIHAALQAAANFMEYDEAVFEPHVGGAFNALTNTFGPVIWFAEQAFAHPSGFGGKADLSCQTAVVDFKTKEFGPEDDLKTWDEHAMQLAAYREGLGMPTARCAIVYVSVTHPGVARLLEIPEEDLRRGWACFKALLEFWKAKNRVLQGIDRKSEPLAGAMPVAA